VTDLGGCPQNCWNQGKTRGHRPRLQWLILLTLASISALSQQQNTLTIQGTISVAGSNQPLSGAQVTLTKTATQGSFPPAIAPILSDNSGNFTFRNLEAGSYRLTALRSGYVREDTSITLANGTAVNNIALRTTPTAVISGRVRDTAGRPVANVPVELLRRAYSQEGRGLRESFSAQTNDRGEYRIFGITPGRYYLAAGLSDSGGHRFESHSFDRQILDGQNAVQIDYLRIFYPGVTDVDKASALDIQPGSQRTNVDFTMARQRWFSVRGRVTLSSTGLPPSNVSWSGHDGDTQYDAKTGRFEITGLPANEYSLWIGSESHHAFVTVVVTDSDIDGLSVLLEPAAIIRGRISAEGVSLSDVPLDRINVRLLRPEIGNDETASAEIDADGTFTLEDVPVGGDYRVVVSGLPSGSYLKAARIGGTDALNGFAHVTRSAEIEVLISSGSGQVRGLVTGSNLQPFAGAQVALIPDKPRYRTELFKMAMTGRDGRFTLSGIAPGDYKLFAFDGLDRFAFFDPEILALFEERGVSIRIAETSEQSVELRAIPAGNIQ
jgi:hypothetical protein